MRRTILAGLTLVITAAPAHAQALDCAGWNSSGFFATATVADVTRCLAAGYAADERDESGLTPLHLAAALNSDPAVAALLLDRGANLEARAELGWTPLHIAVAHNDNSEVVELLLDRGADPKARTGDGETAWDLVQDNDALTSTDAYRRLRELLSD